MNAQQAAVVAHDQGPLAVLAGAGTGKTHTLVERVRRLVAEGQPARRILVVTFSKDAARELEARCARAGLGGVDVSTWHSLAWRILREDETDFAKWEVDTKGLLRRLVSEACGPKGIGWEGADEAGLVKLIGLAAANLWTPDDGDARARAARMFSRDTMLALRAWVETIRLTNERRVLTFDRMLCEAVAHLQNDLAREWWAARWDHVLQDEAQDANKAQIVFAELLARDHRNYVVVGDPGQAIYAFRGSSPAFLMGFAKEWNARTIALLNNYRCGESILNVGNRIIAQATERLPEALIAARNVEGSVSLVTADDAEDEARELAEHITREKEAGAKWSDFAVLWRTNAMSRAVEEALMKAGVPHVIVGAPPFFARREVRALLGYLRVATGRGEEGAVRDCINAPNRFLGAAFVQHVMVHREGRRWSEAVRLAAAQAGIWSKQKASAAEWAALIDRIAIDAEKTRPAEILDAICAGTGYVDWLTRDQGDGDEGEGRASSVKELVTVARRYATVKAFLDFVDQAERSTPRSADGGGDRVVCCSIHRSKGLEWPRVWIIGLVDGVLPHAKAEPEEERRLAYVACTRARDELTLSWPTSQAGRDLLPSPFLRDAGLIGKGRAAA